jgi:hypothetical protein
MQDERSLTLRQVDRARGDLYAISDDLEFIKGRLARLPDRAYVCRLALMYGASVWALIGLVALLFAG